MVVKSKFIKITDNSYLVSNRNSFNKALCDYFDMEKDSAFTKKQIRDMIQLYPIFPCMIVIINDMYGYNKIYIESIQLDLLSESIRTIQNGFKMELSI